MKEEIKVPPLGESISEATVSALLKPAGSVVQMDDELLELATDKVNQVLYAPQAGVFNPTVKEDDVVKIGQVIGYVEANTEGNHSAKIAGVSAKKEKESEARNEKSPVVAATTATSASSSQGPVEANTIMPSLKGSARESVADYLAELRNPATVSQQSDSTFKPQAGGESSLVEAPRETRQKLSKIRKIIAKRLVEVQSTTAMLTTFNEVDLTEVMALREKYKESFVKAYGTRLGFMSFFVKAAVSALKAFPAVNSYIDGDDLVQRNYYAIGIAVGGEKGLVVPVLRDCDRLSFSQIESAIGAYAQKIKEGKLAADDLYGGGFTITNGGVYGSLMSTPILNPNQCAILGMHKISKRPMVIGDQIVIRQMMYLALSYDHRIIDGKEAVSFLVHMKNCLEDPSRMLLEV